MHAKTISINGALVVATKSHAPRNKKALKAVVDPALRESVSSPSCSPSDAPPIPIFRVQGVQRGVDLTDNAALEDRMNAKCWRQRVGECIPGGRSASRPLSCMAGGGRLES